MVQVIWPVVNLGMLIWYLSTTVVLWIQFLAGQSKCQEELGLWGGFDLGFDGNFYIRDVLCAEFVSFSCYIYFSFVFCVLAKIKDFRLCHSFRLSILLLKIIFKVLKWIFWLVSSLLLYHLSLFRSLPVTAFARKLSIRCYWCCYLRLIYWKFPFTVLPLISLDVII